MSATAGAHIQGTNPSSAERVRVLLVDDDPVLLEIATDNLVAAGYDVISAADGEIACQLLDKHKVDVVVTDLEMPNVDGLLLTRRIRQSRAYCDIPVILITGKEQAFAVDAAFEAGATSFLSKPLNWNLFAQSVRFVHSAAENRQQLQIAKEQAQSAAHLKEAILANFSHELRTPLNHIMGFGELLKMKLQAADLEEESQYAEHIFVSGNRLLNMVSDVLFLSRASTEPIDLDQKPCRPRMILEAVQEEFLLEAERKSVKLELLVEHEEVLLMVDRARIVRALEKLVDNAIKFSGEFVSVTIGFTVQGKGQVPVFFVRDQGPGMPEDALASAGDLFEQFRMGMNRDHEGLGAGVRITQLIAQAHQGKVRFLNLPEGGLQVTFTLPAERMIS